MKTVAQRSTGTSCPSLLILGTRGVPAMHGGFETFAERFALYLVDRGWKVGVYCQVEEAGSYGQITEDNWHGIRRIRVNAGSSSLSSVAFDWLSVRHSLREQGLPLVLGYNTAVFTVLYRLLGRPFITNMDGLEWKRAKWSLAAKAWFFCNEWIGALCSTKLVADHPSIAKHLAGRRSREDIVMIPYGAERIRSAPTTPVLEMGVQPRKYFISVARIEPENSILEIVTAYTMAPRSAALICLGKFDPQRNRYHSAVEKAANGRVLFPGTVYEAARVQALRYHALAYCHGHTVGGTNPSLVEALGAGNLVIAHDNEFNRWVAGNDHLYFKDIPSCAAAFNTAEKSGARYNTACTPHDLPSRFEWARILREYEALCLLVGGWPHNRSVKLPEMSPI